MEEHKIITISQSDLIEYMQSKGYDLDNVSGNLNSSTVDGDFGQEIVVKFEYWKEKEKDK